ncbi:hypothetical protein PF007_g3041 [Phytophthora fragariae]|uniref:IPT/TIG domain-containing protein n=1 Tax=Phytophthora fragariae TaxID=53985 RepID=A0A6A3TEB1_9STRA|nr:hypothetical protein PF007_g3041 [Phytophthora fragariae]
MMPKPIASLFLLLASLAIWQLDAAAAQSASPKLLWCASPLSPASLESPSDSWVDVPDTRVALELPNEAVVLISYDVAVSHVTDVQPEGVSQVSELFFRVAVDGSPYRQSATTVDDREPLVTTASGFLVLEIPRGHHDVKLQWRKRGTHVIKWAVASDILDGFAGGRNLIVSAQHRFIWHTQPLTAVSLLTVNKWEAVSGMTLSFRLSEPATIRFFYQLPVRPELVQYSRDTAAYDEIETVLEIDGLRYRETGSYGIVEGSRKSTVQLQGSIIMDLVPGEYSAVLYWKSLLGSSRPWHSSPNALDGFAMGRVLAAVGEWSMDSVSVYHLEQFKPMSVGEWSDVGESVLQFTLPKATQVSLSYNLPLSQSDNPQFSSWTGDSWERVQTRLVIDGISYRHMSSLVDGSVRGIKSARASMVLPLAGGSHTARLQWKNVDGSRWRAVSFITDQSSSYASIFISVNTWNNDPKVVAPTLVTGEEDKALGITGISISDSDSEMALDYEVTVSMSVKNGILTLDPTPGITFGSGNGDRNEYLLFSGTLSNVNAFLANVWYRSYLNWYGDDALRIKAPPKVLYLLKEMGWKISSFAFEARYLLSTTVSCESPKGAQDVLNVSLRLTTNSKDFSQSLTFTYRDSPQVHGINPPYGSSSGGSTIAITGANFFPDEQANCIFNETIVTGLSYKSSRLVLCQSPAVSLSNAVEVSVAVVFDGTQYEAPENFSIYAAPTVAESTPAFITGGGDVLTSLDLSADQTSFG